MRTASIVRPALLAALLASAAPGLAQDGPSERERREAAREEQRRERMNAERAAAEASRERELAEEQARLEAMGAAGETLVLEAERGFFVSLDAFMAEPSGAERTVARVGDVVSSATTVAELDTNANGAPDAFSIQNERPLALEYDGELAPQIELGFRRGTGAAFSVRYWAWSSDASASATSTFSVPDAAGDTGLVVGGIDNQGIENVVGSADSDPEAFSRPFGSPQLPVSLFVTGADSVTASGSFDASRFDLLYTHSGLARPRLELHYRIGLSLLNAEREESATFLWRSFSQASVAADAQAVETVAATADTQGFGLLVGIAGRLALSTDRRWTLRAGLELSGLTNEQDLTFQDSWVFSQDGSEPSSTVAQDTTSSPSKSLITTVDADVAIEGRIGERLRLGLGYRYANWLEALTEERFVDPSNQSLLLSEGLDLDFSGPYVRLAWFF